MFQKEYYFEKVIKTEEKAEYLFIARVSCFAYRVEAEKEVLLSTLPKHCVSSYNGSLSYVLFSMIPPFPDSRKHGY